MSPARVEVLRETVKVAKFVLPPDALPESSKAKAEVIAPAAVPEWERKVAAALWVVAAAIIATLWFAQT